MDENVIMTAVDEAGANLARCRLRGDAVDIIVNPRLPFTDDLVLSLALSAPWLNSYFAYQ